MNYILYCDYKYDFLLNRLKNKQIFKYWSRAVSISLMNIFMFKYYDSSYTFYLNT
jgi:hypothetical protein